jgi:hypothetical protein
MGIGFGGTIKDQDERWGVTGKSFPAHRVHGRWRLMFSKAGIFREAEIQQL